MDMDRLLIRVFISGGRTTPGIGNTPSLGPLTPTRMSRTSEAAPTDSHRLFIAQFRYGSLPLFWGAGGAKVSTALSAVMPPRQYRETRLTETTVTSLLAGLPYGPPGMSERLDPLLSLRLGMGTEVPI